MAFDYSTVNIDEILARAYNQMDELQRAGVSRGRKSGRMIFNVWMGVGKTFMSLTLGLCFKPQTWLIIGSKSSLNAWRSEILKWFPELGDPFSPDNELFQIIRGQAHQRQQQYKNPKALFFITTGGSFIRDIQWLLTKKVKFDVITVDEIQKLGLRNYKTAFYKALKSLIQHIEKKNKHKIKLINFDSGTWTSKGPPQQWPALHLMDPRLFSSYWKFVNTFCIVVNGMFGREITGPKNTEGLAQATYPYVYTVTEEEAKASLPELRRSRLETTLPANLANKYYTLAEELYFELTEGENAGQLISVSSILASFTKLRQFVCCPAIIDASLGEGVAISAVCDKIAELDEHPRFLHNIIFTPFLPSIPIFKSYIADYFKIPANNIITMQGGMEPEEIQECELRFRNDPNTMVLCSTKFAASFNLETALNIYHPHFEWDQDDNKQAESRGRRKTGTQEFINSYYVNIRGSITENMFDVLNRKEYNNKLTYQDVIKLKERLKNSRQLIRLEDD